VSAPLAIEGLVLYPVRIPLGRTVVWASSSESHADYMILELRAGGLRGVAEGTVKLTFAAATLKTLAVAFEEIFAPRLLGVDAADDAALAKALGGIREHRLAKAMIDTAVWDLRAQAAGKPLWSLLGGASPSVKMSFTVTRDSPSEMARVALRAVGGHRIGMLKIKTGQGMERDAEALQAIRTVVGPGSAFYADSNRAYRPEEVSAFTGMLASHGVVAAEDPCAFAPDRAFAAIKGRSRVRLLVDGPCRSLETAHLFLEAGADALSIKLGKTGIGESLAIAAATKKAGARAHVGMLAEGELGALAAASLSAALGGSGAEPWLPCEASYFLQLPEGVLRVPLVIANGALKLPETPGFAALVDWEKVKRLAP
jgi:L-alanine-DL-glutamate epimerase-like enolase superfamily enzyme